MARAAKPVKVKVEGKRPAARKSPNKKGSGGGELEKRLAEALEQQAATSEILHAISSSPTDLDPVFRMILANATRLCGARVATLWLFDGEVLTSVAHQNASPAFAEYLARARIRPGRETTTRRAALERKTIHVADLLSDPDYSPPEFQRKEKVKTVLSVPLLRQDMLVGVVTLWRREIHPFTDRQVALVETFADQAVIAIENVRLFNETKEALERQTATAEILKVIASSPTDVQPVFDVIVESAVRLCGARFGRVYRYDGSVIQMVAGHGLSPNGLAQVQRVFPRSAADDTIVGRVILTGQPFYVRDIEREETVPALSRQMIEALGTRSQVTVPMLRAGEPIGATTMGWDEPEAFDDQQVALLQTFADQAVIAIENVRLFKELESRNRDLTEALEQQTATSEILRVISQSPTDVQPVFDTIAAAALKLCSAHSATVFTFDGRLVQIAALANATPEGAEAIRRSYPRPPGRDNAAGRAVLTRSVVAIADVLEDPEYAIKAAAVTGGFRSALSIPLIRDGDPIGAINVGRREPGPFPDKQIALLQTFADQAVIAIENVRLFKELDARNHDLSEALEQQTATSDILRVISRSPTDVQPVFDTIAAAALKLCGASSAVVLRFDGEMLRLAALANVSAEGADAVRRRYPRPPGRANAASRAVQTRSVVVIPDVLEDPEYDIKVPLLTAGFRSVLSVPLMREESPIGAITVVRPEPGQFPEKQMALLKTFADQAVIAIENVRLFKELQTRNRDLTEALEQQTATSEILRVISQSQTDVQPVFDTIATAALKLCSATAANVFTFDGELIHLAAFVNVNPAYIDAMRTLYPRPLSRDTAVLRAIQTRSVVVIPDVLEDKDYLSALGSRATAGRFRSVLAVPLMREGNAIGGIAVGRAESGPFPDAQVALLQTFADQAVIAIENARLFKELEARTAELTQSVGELRALGEVGQAVSSTLDLETVLRTIVSRATHLAGMDGGSIYEYDEAHEQFYLHTVDRLPDELVDALRAAPIPKGEGALGRMAVTGEPVQIRDVADESVYQSRVREILLRLGFRSVLAVPLLRDDHLLGGLVVNRDSAGEFSPQVIELLKTFATQSALAIQNARLFREIEVKSRELEAASRHKSEFLANMSHELRTPLNAIIGFSEVLAERMFGEVNEKQAEYLGDILESGRHLLSLINDILDLSKIEAGRMELEPSEFDLPSAIDNALTLVRERAQRRTIALGRTVDERLGTIRGDERKVKQVLLNLLSNALKFTPEGGHVDVRAEVRDGVAEISVHDTGVGIAPEDQEAVFEEFRQVGTASKKTEGTGLGLAISRKFVELHGGRMWVTSQVGTGSTFTFTLPLAVDQQRETV